MMGVFQIMTTNKFKVIARIWVNGWVYTDYRPKPTYKEAQKLFFAYKDDLTNRSLHHEIRVINLETGKESIKVRNW